MMLNFDDLIKIAENGIEEEENSDWMFSDKLKQLVFNEVVLHGSPECLGEFTDTFGNEFTDKIVAEVIAEHLCPEEK